VLGKFNKMRVRKKVGEILFIEFNTVRDARGYSLEAFSTAKAKVLGLPDFKYIYISFSKRGVIRGLHYQLPPKAQGKIVIVISGRIFDVVVDIRKKSERFGKFITSVLEEGEGIWIPIGFAHGFQALEDSIIVYLMTEEYSPELYRCIRWDDPSIGIPWPLKNAIISEKDARCPFLANADIFI
jgi:dTDP-4-dehydrorhamnose 3,5-epimerase